MYMWIFIVPLVAKSFEYIDKDVLQFVVFQQSVPFSTSLPFSWIVFYFSALFLAIGNLIIRLRCPKIIKDHPSYQSYLDEGKTLKQLTQYSDDIKFNWGKLASSVNGRITKLQIEKDQGNGGVKENYPNLSTEDPVHYFWPIHTEADTKYKVERFFCTQLFYIGFLLFGLVVIQNMIAVIGFISN
jgi:hypothetical protein